MRAELGFTSYQVFLGFFFTSSVLIITDAACTFTYYSDACIAYNDDETLASVSVEDCKVACCSREWCNSFDYYKNSNRCDLSAAAAWSHSLLMDMADYDHYSLACDASTVPLNGDIGDCTSSLASGSTCQPTCNPGYTVSGTSSCSAGTLTAATCSANPCDASTAPTNGGVGDCTSSLASGSTCQPTCNSGYTVSGTSSCNAGALMYIKLQYMGVSNGLCASMGLSNSASAGCATDLTCQGNENSDLTLQTCNDNDDFQLWYLEQVGDNAQFVFHSKADSTRCIYTGTSLSHGSCEPFTLAVCDTLDTQQLFTQESYDGSSVWRNVATDLAIDANGHMNYVDNWVWACFGSNSAKKFEAVWLPDTAATCSVIPCDASAPPSNGGIGDCTNSLASGSTCQPTCNAGYMVSGTSSCSAGILTAATCSVNPCDASASPANGGAGDCTNSLASGSTCQPTCNSGYTVSGTSSCSEGMLTSATCIADAPTTCTMSQYLSAGACFACPSSTGDPVGTPAPSTSAGGSATYCTCPDGFRAQTGALPGEWTCNKCMDNAEKTGSVVPPPSGNNDVCECVANFFMDNTGLNCDACPTHSTSSVGFAACTCDDNYYAKLDGTWSCEACIGGNLKTGSVVPGTGDGETDADCTSTSCTANQYQVSGMCFACPIGSSSSGGAATECACPGNYSRSVDGITYSCSACAAGKVRAAGDTVPGGAATACDATICGTMERVQSNACAVCPAGTTNAAGGHHASGGDTNCTTDVSPPAANITNTTDVSPPAANTTNTTDMSPPAANTTNTTDVSPPAANTTNTTDVSPPPPNSTAVPSPPPPSPPPPPPPNRLIFGGDYESSATRYSVVTALVVSIVNLYITTKSR